MTFTLLWWHAPVALILLGIVMFVVGQREGTATGLFGAILATVSFIVLVGGWYRGLFI